MSKIKKRIWFQLHGWCSLPVWALFCFICITGTVSVISHELTWLTNADARANNPNNLPEKSKQTLIKNLKKTYPTAEVMSVISYEPYLVNALTFADKDMPFATAYINQYTGEVQAINQTTSFIEFMRTLHGWLYFPWQEGYSVGYYLVSAMAFVILGALVTGLVIYKNFWRAFTQPKIRFKQGSKTLLKDLHTVGGIWSIWFMLIISLTALWYLIQAVMWHNDIDIDSHAPLISAAELPHIKKQTVDLDSAINATKNQFGEFTPTYIMLAEHNRGMYRIMGAGNTILYDNYSYSASVNPWTGKVAASQSPETMTTLQTLSHIADPLHYGTIGGIWTKLIWFVFGVILSGMSITGFMMYSKKLIKAKKQSTVPINDTVEAN